MQLTNEIKSKIFGLYIGCECYHPFTDRIFPINGSVTSEVEGGEDFKLILSPRSEITDEDAIEACRLYFEQPFKGYPVANWKVSKEVKREFVYICVIAGHTTYAFNIDCFHSVIEMYDAGADCTTQSQLPCFDYLRSRGYALPYHGIDLFESGIAIPKTKKL